MCDLASGNGTISPIAQHRCAAMDKRAEVVRIAKSRRRGLIRISSSALIVS